MNEMSPALLPSSCDVTHERVAEFLRQHPDFFTACPDLLRELAPPVRWSGDSVVDLQRYMVETLKDELAGLRDCAQAVIETSRVNMATQLRTHAAVLALIESEDLGHLVRVVTGDLPIFLDIDAAALGLEGADTLLPAAATVHPLGIGEVERLIGPGEDLLLRPTFSDELGLFGGDASSVRSAAFARLKTGEDRPPGMLVLGARQEGAFHPGQGTDLLRFLAQVVELCLKRTLPPPA